jgi:hypothetical protein
MSTSKATPAAGGVSPDAVIDGKLALGILDCARLFGVSRTSICIAIRNGDLKARKLGGRTVVLAEDAREFLRSLPAVSAS